MRQITERHRSVESCAKCHERFDAFGLALERFDAIGRRRDNDLAGRSLDTRVRLPDGTEVADEAGLREYLVTKRRDDFLRQFCRKILGYALGRAVQLSDYPLLDDMQRQLETHDYRVQTAVETIVRSRQFRYARGSGSQR